jgi:hypothetical protein
VEAGLRYSDPAVVAARLLGIEKDLERSMAEIDRRRAIPFNRMEEWGADGRIKPGTPVHSPFIRWRKDLALE